MRLGEVGGALDHGAQSSLGRHVVPAERELRRPSHGRDEIAGQRRAGRRCAGRRDPAAGAGTPGGLMTEGVGHGEGPEERALVSSSRAGPIP